MTKGFEPQLTPRWTALAFAGLLAACAAPATIGTGTATSGAAPITANANARLDSLAESYFEELLPLNPVQATSLGDSRYDAIYVTPFAASVRAKQAEIEDRYAARLTQIPRDGLDEQHRLTIDVMRTTLESAARLRPFPSHLIPINPMFNFTAAFAQLGSGTGAQPFRTVKNYDDFLGRMHGFEQSVDTAIANMRVGLATGVTMPRILMERVLPQLSAHLVTRADSSMFWGPITRMPANVAADERMRLTAAYRQEIEQGIVPAYRRLHDFIRDEYMPRTRTTTTGLSALPNGAAWYAAMARASTTTALSPDEIHRIGLEEVARIHLLMDSVQKVVGFAGTQRQFFANLLSSPQYRYSSREEMLADHREAQARIDQLTDRLFDVKPKATYEIRPVEPFREQNAAIGSYQAASLDGSRPGIFYLNTYDPPSKSRYQKESLLLHEGSPGHHFQITIQRELASLPRVRRFGGVTAYSEGWGLYSESLGRELGVYTDPIQYFGALAGELWRAIRLVLDTGIHSKGWTREQAIQYAIENAPNSETNITGEVERFMSIPGQALAYKIGQRKITELRLRAQRELGPKFDIKAFHRAILIDGALPLDVLDAKIDRWIAAQKRD